MSLKFEIKDWRFEITWSGMVCAPSDENVQATRRAIDRGTAHKSVSRRPQPATMTIKPLKYVTKGEEKK
jgi:hypothetical protein